MKETADYELLEAEQRLSAAYVVKPVSLKVRLAKIAAALSVPLVLAVFETLGADESDPVKLMLSLIWLSLLTLGIALWYSKKVWHRDGITVLATVRHRVTPTNIINKILTTSALFG